MTKDQAPNRNEMTTPKKIPPRIDFAFSIIYILVFFKKYGVRNGKMMLNVVFAHYRALFTHIRHGSDILILR